MNIKRKATEREQPKQPKNQRISHGKSFIKETERLKKQIDKDPPPPPKNSLTMDYKFKLYIKNSRSPCLKELIKRGLSLEEAFETLFSERNSFKVGIAVHGCQINCQSEKFTHCPLDKQSQ